MLNGPGFADMARLLAVLVNVGSLWFRPARTAGPETLLALTDAFSFSARASSRNGSRGLLRRQGRRGPCRSSVRGEIPVGCSSAAPGEHPAPLRPRMPADRSPAPVSGVRSGSLAGSGQHQGVRRPLVAPQACSAASLMSPWSKTAQQPTPAARGRPGRSARCGRYWGS